MNEGLKPCSFVNVFARELARLRVCRLIENFV